MTELQAISHQEQMDAARAEFMKTWTVKELELKAMRVPDREIAMAQFRQWREWRKESGL